MSQCLASQRIRNGSDPATLPGRHRQHPRLPVRRRRRSTPDTVAHGCGASGTALYQVGAIWIDAPRPDCDLDQLLAAWLSCWSRGGRPWARSKPGVMLLGAGPQHGRQRRLFIPAVSVFAPHRHEPSRYQCDDGGRHEQAPHGLHRKGAASCHTSSRQDDKRAPGRRVASGGRDAERSLPGR